MTAPVPAFATELTVEPRAEATAEPAAEAAWLDVPLLAEGAAEATLPAVPLAVLAGLAAVPAEFAAVPAGAVTVLVKALTGPVAAEVTWAAAVVVAGTAELTAPVAPLTTPETVDAAEPSTPPVEPWVAALAGLASSRPMPNATHSPPITAPQVYRNTFRTSWHQPFIRVTLIHS